MSQDKCPFCGANPTSVSENAYKRWKCGTWLDNNYKIRGDACYENQLAQQADLLRECREVVGWVCGGGCTCNDDPNIEPGCPVCKAQALLPKLAEVLSLASPDSGK